MKYDIFYHDQKYLADQTHAQVVQFLNSSSHAHQYRIRIHDENINDVRYESGDEFMEKYNESLTKITQDSKIGVYAGSFDPFTRGHAEIVGEALLNLDALHILVASNPDKSHLIKNVFDRVKLIKRALVDYQVELEGKIRTPNEELALVKMRNVVVTYTDGLTVEYAKSVNARELIRGLRPMGDFESEMKLDQVNRMLAQDLNHPIRTTFISTPNLQHCYTSSSMVKTMWTLDKIGTLDKMVFPSTLSFLQS